MLLVTPLNTSLTALATPVQQASLVDLNSDLLTLPNKKKSITGRATQATTITDRQTNKLYQFPGKLCSAFGGQSYNPGNSQ